MSAEVEPLLALRGVSVTYQTAEGPLPAVRGVDLAVAPGRGGRLAGESGCGKSTLVSTVLRLQPTRAPRSTARCWCSARTCRPCSWGELRALRWAGASIVFQGALHSLNPVQRIGRQIAEPITVHEPELRPEQVQRRVDELLEQVGLSAARARCVPAPAVRRPEAARDDRDGAGLPARS